MAEQELLRVLRSELRLIERYVAGSSALNYAGNGAAVDFLLLESLEHARLIVLVVLLSQRDADVGVDHRLVNELASSEAAVARESRSQLGVVTDDATRRLLAVLVQGAERHQRLLASLQ